MRRPATRDVWIVGGGDLVGQFADAGHLDEIRVSVAPVTLASGKPLLPRRLESDRLTLESVRQVGPVRRAGLLGARVRRVTAQVRRLTAR